MLQSKKSFKLDRNKTYQISGDFRAKAGTPASRIYIGLVPLDKQGMEILPASVNAIHLLETRLTQPAEKGSKVIYVKNATHWNINSRLFWVAFKIRAEYADLPNTNLVPAAAVRPSKEDAGWKVPLAKPLTESYPAGAYVRLHRSGDRYIYCGNRLQSTEAWQTFTGKVSGMPRKLGISRTQLWPGTDRVRFLIMSMEGKRNSLFEFRNMKLEEN